MSKYKTLNHEKFKLNYHLIFSVKFRRKILEPIKDDLFCSLHRAEQMQVKWRIVYMETDKDHIHFFISATPSDSISQIVHSLKQVSTYDMWKQHYDYLRQFFWKEHFLWTRGYFCSTVGDISSDKLKDYILNQG